MNKLIKWCDKISIFDLILIFGVIGCVILICMAVSQNTENQKLSSDINDLLIILLTIQ